MSFSPETIDRIVANVLNQLGTPRPVTSVPPVVNAASASPSPALAPSVSTGKVAVVTDSVITAETLSSFAAGSTVQVALKALITPAANDVVKGRKLVIMRQAASAASVKTGKVAGTGTGLLIVVKNSKPVEQLFAELNGTWRRELVGCPDDAAKLAISELCRGGATHVAILCEQTHRAACLANRNDKVKAVAIRDAGDVRLIRKQLRANTWCIDSTGKTYFEFKNIFREIQS